MAKYEEWRDYPSDGYEKEPYEAGYDDAYYGYPYNPDQFEYNDEIDDYFEGYEAGEAERIKNYGI